METNFFRILRLIEHSKEQHIFDILIFCKKKISILINLMHPCWIKTVIYLETKKKLPTPNFWTVVYHSIKHLTLYFCAQESIYPKTWLKICISADSEQKSKSVGWTKMKMLLKAFSQNKHKAECKRDCKCIFQSGVQKNASHRWLSLAKLKTLAVRAWRVKAHWTVQQRWNFLSGDRPEQNNTLKEQN